MSELAACVVKGCPWRGADPHGCPMHQRSSDEAWERQAQLRLAGRPRGQKLRLRSEH